MTVPSPGSSRVSDRCNALAGVLAELGVTRLILERQGQPPIELHARVTDLPGTLREAIHAGPARLRPPDAAWHLELYAEQWTLQGIAPEQLRAIIQTPRS